MRIAIYMVSNGIGGTERRMSRLLSHLSCNSENEYTLLAPSGLRRILIHQNVLDPRVKAIDLFDGGVLGRIDALQNVRWMGKRLPGLGRLTWPIVKRRLCGSRVSALLNSFDVIDIALPYFIPELPDKPAVIEATDAHLRHLGLPLVREGLRKRAVFSCLSEAIRDGYASCPDACNAKDRIYASPCSFIDHGDFVPAEKSNLIAFVGRMESFKNPILFLEAVRLLAGRRRDFQVFMAGSGRLNGNVDRLLSRYGLNDIVIRRFVVHPQEILARALIFVSIQQDDNYPSQALMEAMACGCAVVASECGETRRLASDDVGFRVPLDAGVIADRLDFLLSNRAVTVEMGAAARIKVLREQKIEMYASYQESLYKRAVEAYTRHRSDC